MIKTYKNKKGIFFTLIGILLSALVLLTISYEYSYQNFYKEEAVTYRINSINNDMKSITNDLSREIYIGGFRTLLGMQDYIDENGEFFNNSREAFKEILITGKYQNKSISIMKNSSLNDWMNRIINEMKIGGIKTQINISKVNVYQNSPWSVAVNITAFISLNDNELSATLNKTVESSNSISIMGLEDPIFTIYSYGRINREIQRSNITNFVQNGNTTGLLTELNDRLYLSSQTAPDYLMRLEGNLSNSTYGIESLVNITELTNVGLSTKDKSIVDYIYFSNRTTQDLCINNSKADPDLPNWFKLDKNDNHVEVYQIGSINQTCG